jgi:hypothetical protein
MIELVHNQTVAIELANEHLANGSLLENHGWATVQAEVYQIQETSCGWICEWESPDWVRFYRQTGSGNLSSSIAGAGKNPILVNRWTGDVVLLNLLMFPNLEAAVRDYLISLPQELQFAAQKYDGISLFSPVRFDPPFLRIGTIDTYAKLPPQFFHLILSSDFLIEQGIDSPELIASFPTVKQPSLENLNKQSNGVLSAKFKISFDRYSIQRENGFFNNRINLRLPRNPEEPIYWMNVQGTIEDLMPSWLRSPFHQ